MKTEVAEAKKGNATTNKKPVAPQKSTTKIDEILNPTASLRIQKMQNFQILADKHQFLTGKKADLEKFIISSDGSKEKVILKNAQGFEFQVSNSQVIEDVLEVVGKKLDLFIEKSEKEVVSYQI